MRLLQIFSLSALVALAAACSGNGSTQSATSKDSTAKIDPSAVTYNGQIAFVRMDSLMRGYGLFIDMSDEFGKKQQKVQGELTAKGRSLEREAMEFQEKAQKGLITQYQAQTTEKGLQKKQQDIMAYRDRMMNELGQEEAAMSATIFAAVSDFLNEFNAEKGYSMIIQTAAGTPVLVADPKLDITVEVLEGLNKRYEEQLAAKDKK